MIRIDHRDPMPEALRGAVLALGNFDGFHQGHQAVVGEAIAWARSEGRPAVVATFSPHPMRHFKPDAEPFRLTSLDQRMELFAAAGADAMLVFHFDEVLASTTAQRWISEVIAGHVGAAGVVTGEDFTFGQGRGGNPAMLRDLGAALGLRARTVGAVHDHAGPISSSRIREALRSGDTDTATRLLTRPFAIRGIVEHGAKLGRSIGFPTANLALGDYLRPRYGIYAATGLLPDGPDRFRRVTGAANLGIRPSIEPPLELLEPHFFDFAGDLYGQEIEVALHAFLRPEATFDSLEELTAQIARDCEEARARLASLI
jgi:riboflavin kinase/FMN adenylyltransferase